MYEIHMRGKKLAVLLAWANLLGYGEAEITQESGTAQDYVLHCEISTRWDVSPFGEEEQEWDGKTVDLSAYTEDAIRSGEHNLWNSGCGIQYLSAFLSVEIESLNRPDDSGVPICAYWHYKNGECLESENYGNPDCETDDDFFDEDGEWDENGFSDEPSDDGDFFPGFSF